MSGRAPILNHVYGPVSDPFGDSGGGPHSWTYLYSYYAYETRAFLYEQNVGGEGEASIVGKVGVVDWWGPAADPPYTFHSVEFDDVAVKSTLAEFGGAVGLLIAWVRSVSDPTHARFRTATPIGTEVSLFGDVTVRELTGAVAAHVLVSTGDHGVWLYRESDPTQPIKGLSFDYNGGDSYNPTISEEVTIFTLPSGRELRRFDAVMLGDNDVMIAYEHENGDGDDQRVGVVILWLEDDGTPHLVAYDPNVITGMDWHMNTLTMQRVWEDETSYWVAISAFGFASAPARSRVEVVRMYKGLGPDASAIGYGAQWIGEDGYSWNNVESIIGPDPGSDSTFIAILDDGTDEFARRFDFAGEDVTPVGDTTFNFFVTPSLYSTSIYISAFPGMWEIIPSGGVMQFNVWSIEYPAAAGGWGVGHVRMGTG